MDTEGIRAFVGGLADAASAAIMPHFRARGLVENKEADHFDPVTAADREAEAAMRALIEAAYPDHGIIGEEYGEDRPDADFVWVLDPIDGTRAFVTGLPTWGTLIGLLHQKEPVFGMMCQPFTGERYSGDGHAAWFEGPGGAMRLSTRACARVQDASLFTTTPQLFNAGELTAFQRVEDRVQLSRYGVDCYAYCVVAAGHADLVVESALKIYDIVALIPIVRGAGGLCTDWSGGSPASGGQAVASGDPRVHEAVLDLLAG